MIRVILPTHLRTLAHVGAEVKISFGKLMFLKRSDVCPRWLYKTESVCPRFIGEMIERYR